MALNTTQIQTQQQILAPVMRQSIQVLMLPVTELHTAIEAQLQENPLLEIDEERTNKDEEKKKIEEVVDNSIRGLNDTPSTPVYDTNSDDETPDKNPIACETALEDYLLNQLHLELSDPLELEIGELIIGNLDENGYFKAECRDIAEKLGLESVEPVEMVLHMVQNFEPLGIAARNLKECLLIQAHFRFNGQSETILKIISEHLEDIGKKRFVEVARQLKITPEKVKEYGQMIAQLEPNPARQYRPVQSNIYVRPDIVVSRDEKTEEYRVHINNEYIPHLRVNQKYQQMLKDPRTKTQEKEYIREKIKNALLFIKSISQRSQTIRDIAEYLVRHQKAFFEGDHLDLRPMNLKEVAAAIERNESTVSRAISNKYMQTPQGLLPLKYFFSAAIKEHSPASSNGSVSNRGIKEEIKWLINEEDKSKPLSDQAILEHFTGRGVQLARRTVSKYRKALNILPSHLRKN